MGKMSEAQIRAQENYKKRVGNEVLRYRNYRSKAKKFIREMGNKSDLMELKSLLENRIKGE